MNTQVAVVEKPKKAKLVRVTTAERPDTVHGRLLEAVHISGYSFERACAELEWLLDEDRWKKVGGGFDDINQFIATLDLSSLRPAADARKKIAQRLAALDASQNATGRMLGVSDATVARDKGKARGATNVAQTGSVANKNADDETDIATNVAPSPFATDPAKAAKAPIVRAANQQARTETAAKPSIIPAGKYGTIVIDPPWPMEKIEREVRPNQVGFDYPTLREAEIAAYSVAGLAADDCHLFCWTTQKFLPMALRCLDAWGFRYVLTMVWHKPGGFQPVGLPQFNCEFVLYARKGAPKFIDTKAFNCCFQAPRREHSRKPDEFYDLIRRVTAAPRVDVFSREKRDGFDQAGNEVEKFEGAA